MELDATVGIIGAGPIGLEMAASLKEAGISYIQFDKGQIAQTIFDFPPETRFFSSSERIGIAGIPIHTVDQQKCSRENYLAYLRMVAESYHLKVNSYEEVTSIEKTGEGFNLETQSTKGKHSYHVRYLILATGGLNAPRHLEVPGEELPHVSTKMEDPHQYFQKQVVIVGGKNSAVEGAIRLFHAGVHVTMIVRRGEFDADTIKYWLLPELLGRIKKGQIVCHYNSQVKEIHPDRVTTDTNQDIPCDFVIKAIGFKAEMDLFQKLGVTLSADTNSPQHDSETMETDVSGVYALGTVIAGTQEKFKIYIENTHQHVGKILASLCQKLQISEPAIFWVKKRFRTTTHLEE